MAMMDGGMFKWIGMLSTIFFMPAILLSLSFFVLYVLGKIEARVLKFFGWLVVLFLWLTSILSFIYGAYSIHMSCKMKNSMTGMMKEKGKMQQQGAEESGVYVK